MLEWLGCEYRKRPQAPGRSLLDHSFKMLSGTGVWNLTDGRHPQQRSPSTTCWHPHDRSLWAQWEWIRPRACGWNPLGSEREKEIIVASVRGRFEWPCKGQQSERLMQVQPLRTGCTVKVRKSWNSCCPQGCTDNLLSPYCLILVSSFGAEAENDKVQYDWFVAQKEIWL